MSIMAAAIQNTYHHRPYHLPSASGDISCPPSIMERSWRAESYHRKQSALAVLASPTSSSPPRSNGQSDAHSPPYPLTTPNPSPRSTMPQASSTSPTPSLRANMSFCNTTATSSWGLSPGAQSPSPPCSSPPPQRIESTVLDRCLRDAEFERGDDDNRIPEHDGAENTRRSSLTSLPRPSQTIRARTRSLDARADALLAGGLPQPTFSSRQHTYRERQESWSPDVPRSLLPPLIPLRSAYPEFIEGPSHPHFFNTRRGDTLSPPPSPSPSTSSFGTNAYSGGRTDTEPTDEDDYVKCEQESVELPPLQLDRPSVPQGGQILRRLSDLDHRAPVSLVHRDARSPILRPAVPLSSSSPPSAAAPHASPESPFRHGAKGDIDAFPVQTSDVRTRILRRSGELPSLPTPSAQPTRSARCDSSPLGERPAMPPRSVSARSEPAAEHEWMSPTPKKYRFVASNPSATRGSEDDTDPQCGHLTAVVSPIGTKRRYESTSPDSSDDGPLADRDGEDDGPRKRGRPRQQPYDVGSFVAGGSGMPGVRGPRGAIVPAYHYDTERALKCAFPACGSVLTGKKSETASHMRSHFMQAAGQTLYCPWPVETEDGQRVKCGMPFKDSANFGRHVSSRHIKAEEYQCNRCGRPFARRDAALRHMKTLCRVDAQTSRRKKDERKRKPTTADEGQDGE